MMPKMTNILLKKFVLLAGGVLVAVSASCKEPQPTSEERQMKPADAAYIQVAANPKASLPDRVKSLQSLSAGKDPALAMKLKELLGRPRGNDRPGVNFDPAAAERLVDLQAIAALHRAGDDSEVPRIAKLVAQAGDVLKGADDERRNAAAVIREIGKGEPIADLTRLAGDKDAKAVRNAVLTVPLLYLLQRHEAQRSYTLKKPVAKAGA